MLGNASTLKAIRNPNMINANVNFVFIQFASIVSKNYDKKHYTNQQPVSPMAKNKVWLYFSSGLDIQSCQKLKL
jgi:hypothetical protein